MADTTFKVVEVWEKVCNDDRAGTQELLGKEEIVKATGLSSKEAVAMVDATKPNWLYMHGVKAVMEQERHNIFGDLEDPVLYERRFNILM